MVRAEITLGQETEGDSTSHGATNPSPHSPAQPHVVQRYGRAEHVGAVGAG